jgi:hypothetical protein
MKIAAGILGILAGIFGVIGGFAQVFFAAVGKEVGGQGAEQMGQHGAAAFWLSFVIILFGGILFAKPKISGIALCVLGLITAILGNIFSGPLAVVAGILGYFSKKKNSLLEKTT